MTRLGAAMIGWIQVKEAGADLLTWWQNLVMGAIKQLAKSRGTEFKKERLWHLNILKIRQAYLASKINGGTTSLLTLLIEVKLKVTQWYENESKSIILTSRAWDINKNENVQIYPHGIHTKFQQKSSILAFQLKWIRIWYIFMLYWYYC